MHHIVRSAAAPDPQCCSGPAAVPHFVIVYQLVHAAGAQGGAYCVRQRHARIDVADQLRLALAGVRPLLQEDDLRLLWCPGRGGRGVSRGLGSALVAVLLRTYTPFPSWASSWQAACHQARQRLCLLNLIGVFSYGITLLVCCKARYCQIVY